MMRTLVILALALTLLFGCGFFDSTVELYNQSKEVEAEMSRELGVETFVGFNYTNGSLNDVTIAFIGMPENLPVEEMVARAKSSVSSHFESSPKQVTVSITVPAN
jgi:hypothetical protein